LMKLSQSLEASSQNRITELTKIKKAHQIDMLKIGGIGITIGIVVGGSLVLLLTR
jgi:hypothetical protein